MTYLSIIATLAMVAISMLVQARGLNRRRELEGRANQRDMICELSESVRFLRGRTDSLEAENADLKKQLGMNPMRRSGFQHEPDAFTMGVDRHGPVGAVSFRAGNSNPDDGILILRKVSKND